MLGATDPRAHKSLASVEKQPVGLKLDTEENFLGVRILIRD